MWKWTGISNKNHSPAAFHMSVSLRLHSHHDSLFVQIFRGILYFVRIKTEKQRDHVTSASSVAQVTWLIMTVISTLRNSQVHLKKRFLGSEPFRITESYII
jgi:hypothetical protein